MPTSLPPLPDEIGDESSAGSASSPAGVAFGGGQSPTDAALAQIENGYQRLAMAMPSAQPLIAQAIAQLRMFTQSQSPAGAGAGANPSGGPTGPAITGMGQNPTALPAPPPPGM